MKVSKSEEQKCQATKIQRTTVKTNCHTKYKGDNEQL